MTGTLSLGSPGGSEGRECRAGDQSMARLTITREPAWELPDPCAETVRRARRWPGRPEVRPRLRRRGDQAVPGTRAARRSARWSRVETARATPPAPGTSPPD